MVPPSTCCQVVALIPEQSTVLTGFASWLELKKPSLTTNLMQSQLSRLFGQLYAMEVSV